MEISDFSTLVQALTGVVALIVSILALLQQKKIKELADITFELKEQTEKLQKQNDILEKRFNLEKVLTLEQRIPVFEKFGRIIEQGGGLIFEFKLKNVGRKAFNITAKYLGKVPYTVYCANNDIENNKALTLTVKYDTLADVQSTPFNFELISESNQGFRSRQKIVQEYPKSNPLIYPPMDMVN